MLTRRTHPIVAITTASGRGAVGIVRLSGRQLGPVIEAVMLWNEPNNMSHWDAGLDRGWTIYADMVKRAGAAVPAENPRVQRVLGGMSPIDPGWIGNMAGQGALDAVDVVAIHGFPLDWNLWSVDDWPHKLQSVRDVTDKPVWVTEVGVSTFANEEVQRLGLKRTAEQVASSSGARAEFRIRPPGNPVTFNDPALTERMRPTLERVAGAGRARIMQQHVVVGRLDPADLGHHHRNGEHEHRLQFTQHNGYCTGP